MLYCVHNNNNNEQGQKNMFIKVTKEDLKAFQSLSKSAILVYFEMRFYAGIDGRAFPSKATLSDNTGLSIGSIKRALRELKEIGVIEVTNARRTSSNEYKVQSFKNEPEGVKSNPKEVQKKAVGGTKKSFEGIEKNPLSKDIKKKDKTYKEIEDTHEDIISESVDIRDLWLGQLFSKHEIPQGWRSVDIQSDFDLIKNGMSVLQIAKACKKFDHWITERNVAGIYMGTGNWARKFRERWVSKESDTPLSKYDQNKMYRSTLKIDSEFVEELKSEANSNVIELKKQRDIAMEGQSLARSLWANFRKANSYHDCANNVFEWVISGQCTSEILEQIKNDSQLKDFLALIDCADMQRGKNV